MNSITTLCIFIVILFLYIHIANQFKKSDDLEIYETDFTSTKHLEDVCELKQPVLMNMVNITPNLFSDIVPENIARFSSHDVNIKDCNDYYKEDTSSIDSVLLPFHTTIKFLESDKNAHLFSENNGEFLEESGLIKKIKSVDNVLKPSFTINSKYDLWFGSCGTSTPLRYHTDSRQFLFITTGKIRVKMTSWKSTKYLHPYKDYEKYEFRSLVHPIKPDSMYLNDHEKTNFIEFDVKPGYLLYIPSYWWYSITYLDDPSTYICSITYNTFINYVSNSWDLSIYFLQQQNIKQKPPKNINYEEVLANNEEKEETHTTDTTPISELNEKNTVDTNIKTEEIKENEEIKEEDIIDISSNLTEIKKLPEKENNITYTISSI
tara:strand:- start:16499 stop:17629 length:1131 start_codon:yes stop_codon:yes gene_type:complete